MHRSHPRSVLALAVAERVLRELATGTTPRIAPELAQDTVPHVRLERSVDHARAKQGAA